MNMKSKCTAWIVLGLVSMIYGCIPPTLEKESVPAPLPASDSSLRCVSKCVTADSPLREFDRQMCLAASSGKDLEYWIDGERETPGCHWHLTHMKCQEDGCIYRCCETETLWHLTWQKNCSLKMSKTMENNSTLRQEYIFSK